MSRDYPMIQAYAKACYELLKQQTSDFQEFVGIFKQIYEIGQTDSQVKRLLKEPFVSAAFKIDLVYKLCPRLSENEVLRKLVCLLADKKKLFLILELGPTFEKIINQESNLVDIELIATTKLPVEQVEKVKSSLEKSLNQSVKIRESIDQNLIAGLVIKTNEYVLDNSLKGRLNKMKQILINNN
ncbi:MAG: ATP synthase F1 subunit delta [Candidatus Caenarcaniphilales bacterium]|nr:ATP synthase F1 subunit delta [Candidatus Caenarcaniphilales bacterium]